MTAETAEIPGYIAGTWDIDPVHSHIGFAARHLMISKISGKFTRFEGQIITADDPLQSSATATLDMTSIDTSNAQRNSAVRAAGILDAAACPTMTFRSTGVRLKGGRDFAVDGELTVRGVTRPIELAAEVNGFGPDPYGVTRAGFSAIGEINRSDYGISVGRALPSCGLVIGKKIQLTIEVEASLRKEE